VRLCLIDFGIAQDLSGAVTGGISEEEEEGEGGQQLPSRRAAKQVEDGEQRRGLLGASYVHTTR
jgi:hypothetical protein